MHLLSGKHATMPRPLEIPLSEGRAGSFTTYLEPVYKSHREKNQEKRQDQFLALPFVP
jgi:hypothetical protein